MLLKKEIWLFVSLLYSVFILGNTTKILKGKEFPEDILIGRSTLLDNGAQWDRNLPLYHITLLAVEGNVDNYNLDSGYFMGYQWVNDIYTQSKDRVNIQLYRMATPLTRGSLEGSYTLMHETGWIYCEAGLNLFYFNESIPFDMSDNIKYSYVMAFMIPKYSITPVLHSDYHNMREDCPPDRNNTVLEARVTSSQRPAIGQSVDFRLGDSTDRCDSYYIQGIYLTSTLASTTFGGWKMYVASKDRPLTLLSHTPFTGQGMPSNQIFQIIRPDSSDRVLSLTTDYFNIPKDKDCNDRVTIGEQSELRAEDYKQLGNYCGDKTDIFKTKTSSKAYVKIDMFPNSNYRNTYGYGYKFTIKSVTRDELTGVILAAVFGSFLLILFVSVVSAIICCCCITKRHGVKGKVLSMNSNTVIVQQPPQPGQNIMYGNQYAGAQVAPINNPATQASTVAVKPYPVQSMPVAQQPPSYEAVYPQQSDTQQLVVPPAASNHQTANYQEPLDTKPNQV